MKILLAGLLTFGSLTAFAFHPGDNDRVVDIGVGTKLTVLRDLNLIPNKDRFRFKELCSLRIASAKNFDRVLAVGSVLKITNTIHYANTDIIEVDNANIAGISCKPGTTIGDFKSETQGIFEIKLADPTRI